MIVFDKNWFIIHQSKLLYLLRFRLFRWCLRINTDKRIVHILPNAYFVKGREDNEYIGDFRTHDKYSKRIYYAFKFLWYLLHFIDSLKIPQLNFGFDTLTVYPDPYPFTTTLYATVGRIAVDETWSTIIAGVGNTMTFDIAVDINTTRASTTTNQFDVLDRFEMLYDTSSLTPSASINSAILSIYGTSPGINPRTLGTPPIHICKSNPSLNTVVDPSDFQRFIDNTSYANITVANWINGAYENFVLNTQGLLNISKNSISKFGMRSEWDITGSFTGVWSSGAEVTWHFSTPNQTGTSEDPKLVITYTVTGAPFRYYKKQGFQ